jgi:coniferyl-aldehyde dehydrogenase
MPSDVVFLPNARPSINPLEQALVRQRTAFAAQPLPDASQRKRWLSALHDMLVAEQDAIGQAIAKDFGRRSRDETRLAELLPCLQGIHHARRHLAGWMRPSRRKVSLAFQPATAQVVYQPLGVVGIIVPWNYPLFLAIGPLTCALAAGNRVMLKMSETSPATGELLKALLAKIFPEDLVSVVLGDTDMATAFSALPFDHLLFTGSTSVGRKVMAAAAQNLTPVTLELGGKSPVLIGANACMAAAAQRIAFGKTLNAGQTCVAPDYVMVPRSRMAEFSAAYTLAVHRLFPSVVGNPDYTLIINQHHTDRLNRCLHDASIKGATITALYPMEEHRGRCLPPTLVEGVDDDMLIMQDEIFGPLLATLAYDDFQQALAYINAHPRPLALYYFGHDRDEQQQVLEGTHSGGVCINDTLLQAAQHDLPFGGVGPSGMGHYHGHEGFLTFSKARGVVRKGRLNSARLIYPPYGGKLQKLVRWLFIR